ncbi:hypothetical protein AOLI_G00024870 [Acnodon oligacanthus]
MKQPVPVPLTFLLWASDTWPELWADLRGPAPDPPPDPPLHVAFITKRVHPKALHTHGCQAGGAGGCAQPFRSAPS